MCFRYAPPQLQLNQTSPPSARRLFRYGLSLTSVLHSDPPDWYELVSDPEPPDVDSVPPELQDVASISEPHYCSLDKGVARTRGAEGGGGYVCGGKGGSKIMLKYPYHATPRQTIPNHTLPYHTIARAFWEGDNGRCGATE